MEIHKDKRCSKALEKWIAYEVETAASDREYEILDKVKEAPDMTPIEQIVFFALKRNDGEGWEVRPQQSIGKYRADFVVEGIFCLNRSLAPRKWEHLQIVVECDGHDYHEKTKEQAQHDKKRDREMQSMGFKVFRFTGSEIWNTYGKCVLDAMGVDSDGQ